MSAPASGSNDTTDEPEVMIASEDIQRKAKLEDMGMLPVNEGKKRKEKAGEDSDGTEEHEQAQAPLDPLEAAKKETEEMRKKLKRFTRLGVAVGFNMKEEALDGELDRAKKLRKLNTWVEEHGGYDMVTRHFKREDKRVKADYHNVILAPLDIAPNDVVLVHWGLPGTERMYSFAMVCIDPDPDAPREVCVELALRPRVTVCVQSRSSLVNLFSPRMLDDHLGKVFDPSNLRALHRESKNEGELLTAFTRRMWLDSKSMILSAHREVLPRINVWAKKWEEKNASAGTTPLSGDSAGSSSSSGTGATGATAAAPATATAAAAAIAPNPLPPYTPQELGKTPPKQSPLGTYKIARITHARPKDPAPGYWVWIVWEGWDNTYNDWRDAHEVCLKYTNVKDRVDHLIAGIVDGDTKSAASVSGLPMAELIALIREHPELKPHIQNVVQRSDLAEPAKMQAIQRIVREKKAPDPPPPPKQLNCILHTLKEGKPVPLPNQPPHGTKITIECEVPRTFNAERKDTLLFLPWGSAHDINVAYESWPRNEATYPSSKAGKLWYVDSKPGAKIQFQYTVWNKHTNLFPRGSIVRTKAHDEHMLTAGAWVADVSKRVAVYNHSGSFAKYHVSLPANITPGAVFFFRVNDACCKLIPPKEGEPGYKMTVWMKVPAGKRAQCNMVHLHEDGMFYSLKVPHRLSAGELFQHTITLQPKGKDVKNMDELIEMWAGRPLAQLKALYKTHKDLISEIKTVINDKQRRLQFTQTDPDVQAIVLKYVQKDAEAALRAAPREQPDELGSSILHDIEPMHTEPIGPPPIPGFAAAVEAAARGVGTEDNDAVNALADLARARDQ